MTPQPLLVLALAVLTLSFAGCMDDDGVDVPPYTGPKAELGRSDVPVDGMQQAGVECGTATHLLVEYRAGDEMSGDFTVKVYSESSRQDTDDEGNPKYSGIAIFPSSEGEGTFSGAENGTFETDLSGTAGTWLLEVHRSRFHDGSFIARLTCAV